MSGEICYRAPPPPPPPHTHTHTHYSRINSQSIWNGNLLLNNMIFIILFRGASFRTEFAKLEEVRSLLHLNTRIMALTATATKSSQKQICRTLGMVKPNIIAVSPDRPNIEYRVKFKRDTVEEQFSPLVEELKRKRTETDRSVIFCRS